MARKRKYGKFDNKKYEWIKTFKLVVVAAVAALVLLAVIVGTSRVDGQSMSPTLKNSQVVAYLRIGGDYQRGDIVAIKMPSGDRYVKRIIGLPGDTVDIQDGRVIVNGSPLNEPYTIGSTNADYTAPADIVSYPCQIPDDKYFVLGDNREHSTDSRAFGPIIAKSIKGKLLGH